ncbi:hypothetical protein [Mycobacterium botniense]|uniref:YCII-related domain-containing protein n=1 Tax=Mycobacterium botniense TaxID=84962 RepID=A0A7I9Y198_9MYCO|nr:hypothetical protein [Mycobacterium botniense]GFG75845.1 hypothetical protein MBOT_32100 [Mycobacterium botniense]
MKTFTDDEMNQQMINARPYSLVILKPGPNSSDESAPSLMWEHARRNFGLRDAGVLAATLVVLDDSDLWGIRVLTGTVDDTVALMNEDPAVAAGIFTVEVHPCRGFVGGATEAD